MAWEWAQPSISTISAKVNAKCQTVKDARTLLHKIGMVRWVYYFVVNPNPAYNKAILNSESALLAPESKELS